LARIACCSTNPFLSDSELTNVRPLPTWFSRPIPLHPAVVHFPIVLLLLGSAMAWVTVFIPRGTWARIAAACLVGGAAGAVLAGQTGEHESESVQTPWGSKGTLETHEEWAERTQVAALAVAVLAIGVLGMRRWPMLARTMAIATAVGALASTWCVIETGHSGGLLVYRYGTGIRSAADFPKEKTPIDHRWWWPRDGR
jgi:uncharacterized membrane protein